MNTIKLLIEGYAKITPDGWEASGSTSLILTGDGKKIIVDPGCNRDLLLTNLTKENVTPEEIDFVFITHHHLDHAMNIALFSRAQVIDEEAIYTQDKAIEGVEMIPVTDITVLKTPGHEYGHASLIVPTAEGTVVIAGDVFWWQTDEEQKVDIEKADSFAENMDELIKSRKEILALADFIIPGHGKMWRNTKN